MKTVCFFILILFNSSILFGQFNHPFPMDQYSSSCISSERNHHGDIFTFKYVDSCLDVSGSFQLKRFDSSKYFRHGISTWYFDAGFKTPKAIIPFYLGMPYGYIKTFYPNGKIKSEGMCRTIRYFQVAGSKYIFRIDKKDTVIIYSRGTATYDSIQSVSANSFIDPVTPETAYKENGDKGLVIFFPYYQKQKSGQWKYYDTSGKLIRRENYRAGKPVKD